MSPTSPKRRSQVAAITIWTVAFNLLAIAAVLLVVYRTRQVGWWILIAACAALALDPVVSWLCRRGFKRWLAVLAVMMAGLALASLLAATLVPILIDQGSKLIASAPHLIERLRDSSLVQWADARFDVIDRAKQQVGGQASGAAAPLLALVQNVFAGVVGAITVTALTVFMLLFGGRAFDGALQWIAPSERPRYVELGEKIRRSVGGYVGGALIISLVGGVVTTLATAVLGVPFFLPLGLAMAVLGILPYVGSVLGGALVVSTTFLTAGLRAGLIALVILVVYQQAENHVLQPVVQRKTIKMSPLVIAVVMLVGTALWGLMGALLSLPIAGAIQVLLEDRLTRRRLTWQTSPSPVPPVAPDPPGGAPPTPPTPPTPQTDHGGTAETVATPSRH
jgi:putative heme transporter